MKKTACTAFLILCSVVLYSQNTKKAFKLLEKLDYEKARSVFNELVGTDNQNPAANFGLAMVYSDDKSPFFNLIQAWSYCRILQTNIDKLLQEDLETIGEYFLNTEQRRSNRPVKKKIEYAIETVEAHLIKYVREENNLVLAYEVIEKFPDFKYYGNVIHIRNQLEFRKYEKQNTLEGYLEFLDKFPDAAQVEKAVKYCHKLAFEKACTINTVAAYDDYLHQYPDAVEFYQAMKNRNALAFKRSREINTMQGYDDFIERYPGALEIAEAKLMQKQLLYEYARKIKTLEAYDEFIRKYPEGQQYIDIFNLKSLDLGMKYISASTITSNNIQWTRSFDLGGEKETSGSIEVLGNNSYVLSVTSRKNDTSFSDVWMLRLDSDGKMIWNRTFGEKFDDQVLFSSLNQKNEIILAGYTWIGIDSSARETWLLKQGEGGSNIWSKKIGKWSLNALAVDKANNILVGGYQVNDSSDRNYFIMILNDLGRKLWSRTYSGSGEVMFLGVLPDQSVLVLCNNWMCRMDIKGYLKWEYTPASDESYMHAMISENGEIYAGGIKNGNNLFVTKFGTDGKKKWEKQYTVPDTLVSVKKVISVEPNKALLLLEYQNAGSGLSWINCLTGELIKSSVFNNCKINDLLIDVSKNLILLVEDKNSILIRITGSEF
jgi:outer membrane protein assembly factor BamB